MNLHDLHPADGSRRKTQRVGCGAGCGKGKTSGRGHKGQKSRSGGGVRPGFEGGQMPLVRRIPKRGFNNYRFAKTFQVVNLSAIAERFEAGSTVGVKELFEKKLIKNIEGPVKVLAKGEVDRALTVKANAFSAQAVRKLEAAGGKAEVV